MKIIPNKTRVQISAKHWLRANSLGMVESFDSHTGRYLIRFDDPGVGLGFDGGRYLLLQDLDLEIIEDPDADE
jgi:hypothetical protein